VGDLSALVTGATGFIGSHLVAEMRRLSWSVNCVCLDPISYTDSGIRCINGNLNSPETLDYDVESIGPVNAVFHLAAQLPGPGISTLDYLKANTLATATLLDSFHRLKAPVFVFTSSLPIIGKPIYLPINESHPLKPTLPYHVSKLAAELLCEQVRISGTERIVSLRITSPYGAWMSEASVLPHFVKLAMASKDIILHGRGTRVQNFVHVSDIVNACLLAVQSRASGVYNIGGSKSISMHDLAELIVKLTPNCNSRIVYSGIPDPQEDYRWEVDLTEAKRGLGYEPKISLEEGIRDYIDLLQSSNQPVRWWTEK